MAKFTVTGHPLHPQIVHVPLGLLPFSVALDAMHLATRKPAYAEGAYYSMVGDAAGAVAAAAAGAGNYFAIPPGGRTKRYANLHAALNVGLLMLTGVNLLLRRGRRPPTGPVPVALSAVGTGGLLVSAWYGGALVYHQGLRVKGVDPIAHAPEAKLPGDERAEALFTRLGDATPAEGDVEPVASSAGEDAVLPVEHAGGAGAAPSGD